MGLKQNPHTHGGFIIVLTQMMSILENVGSRVKLGRNQDEMMERLPLLLLQPPGACREFTRSGSCYPPLGLCQLAAMVTEKECVVLDADGLNISFEDTISKVVSINPRAVGLTLTTYTFEMIEKITLPLFEAGFDILIGGPQATLDPKGTMERLPHVRWVFCGEAEKQMQEIVDRLDQGRDLTGISGILSQSDSNVERQVIEDFTDLPFPRYEGLPLEAYWCPDAKSAPMVTVMTARGCPHRCGFCSSPALLGRKVRGWSVDQVLEHLEYLVNDLGIKEISFVDDVFTINRKRLVALCKGIVERNLDFTWFCNSRADQVNQIVAKSSSDAGCHQMYLGFESGDQRILDDIVNKDATLEDLINGADLLKQYGINRSVGFVIGLPTENEESVQASLDLAFRVKPERIQFTRWTPLVASPLAKLVSTTSHKTFHGRGGISDQIDHWIQMLYDSVEPEPWGKASW